MDRERTVSSSRPLCAVLQWCINKWQIRFSRYTQHLCSPHMPHYEQWEKQQNETSRKKNYGFYLHCKIPCCHSLFYSSHFFFLDIYYYNFPFYLRRSLPNFSTLFRQISTLFSATKMCLFYNLAYQCWQIHFILFFSN